MHENAQDNIPDEWVGKLAFIRHKTTSTEPGQSWGVDFVEGVIEEKNDLGLRILPLQSRGFGRPPSSPMLIAYDALVTVEIDPES